MLLEDWAERLKLAAPLLFDCEDEPSPERVFAAVEQFLKEEMDRQMTCPHPNIEVLDDEGVVRIAKWDTGDPSVGIEGGYYLSEEVVG